MLREYRGALDELGVDAGARHGHERGARRDEPRRVLRPPRPTRSASTPELLSGEEEAALSFLGATADLDAPAPYLVVDIGGGSTEFVLGTDEPDGLVSLDIGCVRITEQFLDSDPPAPEELSTAVVGRARPRRRRAARACPASPRPRTLVGLAGTVTTVAAIEQGLPEYDRERIHHFRLTRAAAEDVFRTLATETGRRSARHNPGLEPGRVDVIVGGADRARRRSCGRSASTRCSCREADILDGLVRQPDLEPRR